MSVQIWNKTIGRAVDVPDGDGEAYLAYPEYAPYDPETGGPVPTKAAARAKAKAAATAEDTGDGGTAGEQTAPAPDAGDGAVAGVSEGAAAETTTQPEKVDTEATA